MIGVFRGPYLFGLIGAALAYSAAAHASSSLTNPIPDDLRGIAKRSRKTTLHHRHGDRECDRRRRQIARGSINPSNGLSTEDFAL